MHASASDTDSGVGSDVVVQRHLASFKWEDAIPMLQAGTVRVRPARLVDAECQHEQVFLENPVLKRRKGDDRWRTSGGEKGSQKLTPSIEFSYYFAS